ncbi:integral membrane sensor signal transduction histidine kinase [Thermincola ferriacetica]|uniref:histidine kinase n=1 Tax=Thermincola ferriacetica TaxID=281456 RepID=A0A0L6VY13_9FIRM|nr:MASE3 domain-containing protein [Thermincola ferriacetica]KNZ68222.1 integral membrane sensor signal transduction histidine kinase [Thermincola ferriacetica]
MMAVKDENPPNYLSLPKLRQDWLLILVFVLVAGILIVGWLPRIFYFDMDQSVFLTLHIVLMLFSVVVSCTVFVAAWYDFKQTRSLRELVLCLTFFMVGLIDVAHTLSYHGMPNFLTENSLNKSTLYWVLSRSVESLGLLTAVVINPIRKSKLNPGYFLAGAAVFTLVIIISIGYYHPKYPAMFIPGEGQTWLKVFLDYLVIVLKGIALYHLIRLGRKYSADYYLQAALIFGIFSEAAFTLYASAYDTYNVLGHVYKIFEFAYIMRALFILSVVRLYQTNTVLHNQKRQMAEINLQLEKANRLKNEFLANTSHELRTPLTAIIAFTELLLDEETGPLNNRQRDYINEINESSQQLLNYINNLLDMAKIEAGKFEVHREAVSISDLCSSVLRKTEPIFKLKKQQVIIDVEDNIPPVYVDPPKMMQVLINLLSNAHKFTPEDGRIELRARMNDRRDQVIVSVSDNGVGISSENLELIFEKFRQVNNRPEPLYQGTGLGLALVKHIVEMHGGQVKVESILGQGSTFYFSIPLIGGEKSE